MSFRMMSTFAVGAIVTIGAVMLPGSLPPVRLSGTQAAVVSTQDRVESFASSTYAATANASDNGSHENSGTTPAKPSPTTQAAGTQPVAATPWIILYPTAT